MNDDQVMSELAAMRRELEALRAQRAKRWRLVLVAGLLAAGAALAQPVITTFTADAPAVATDVNANFTNLRSWSVPLGAILLFEGSCPAGYAEYSSARGRFVLGTPAGGTPGVTFGNAFVNLENREAPHAHGAFTSTFAGYASGEVNYAVQPGFASPWMIRQNVVVDQALVRTNELVPSIYLRLCRKT